MKEAFLRLIMLVMTDKPLLSFLVALPVSICLCMFILHGAQPLVSF